MAWQVASSTGQVVPSPAARSCVTPILDRLLSAESSTGAKRASGFKEAETMLAHLFKIKTRTADESLAVLMNFYVGEAIGQDLIHEVTVRGKRMLPLVIRYRNDRVVFPGREYPTSMRLDDSTRKEDFERAIHFIEARKIYGQD